MSLHTGVYRGQHPHARIHSPSNPAEWSNPVEIERCIWEAKYMPELVGDYNPIAQYGSGKGQDMEHHADTMRDRAREKLALTSAGSSANKFAATAAFQNSDLALAQMSKLQKKQIDRDGDGKLSGAELAANGFSEYASPQSDKASRLGPRTRLSEDEVQRSAHSVALRIKKAGMVRDPDGMRDRENPNNPPLWYQTEDTMNYSTNPRQPMQHMAAHITPKPKVSPSSQLPRTREKANATNPDGTHRTTLDEYRSQVSKFDKPAAAPNRDEQVYQQLRALVGGFS